MDTLFLPFFLSFQAFLFLLPPSYFSMIVLHVTFVFALHNFFFMLIDFFSFLPSRLPRFHCCFYCTQDYPIFWISYVHACRPYLSVLLDPFCPVGYTLFFFVTFLGISFASGFGLGRLVGWEGVWVDRYGDMEYGIDRLRYQSTLHQLHIKLENLSG